MFLIFLSHFLFIVAGSYYLAYMSYRFELHSNHVALGRSTDSSCYANRIHTTALEIIHVLAEHTITHGHIISMK
ncbi:hypothetical protein P153DRAFT_5463 [Dothidotthia symphoricarpi CBS 119687]|uniref:Uncharacterized protein n=1 Tax=Dothidotthia symphoricarpi CBS 119687 TaxID=1392245 RepID=A0A6A6AUN8_9PLEO|nr:uncharacterized protein P153DRAFT_5463 [Dothidotthia symphoricarpi CBS 119687]KAF2134587.1 hypothetical protein P153DRAFT_5463 [Dothidotthia symphoricarpi CBS 119687]